MYCGIFKEVPSKVDAPLVPVVVKVILFCLVENHDVRFKLLVSVNANLLLNVVFWLYVIFKIKTEFASVLKQFLVIIRAWF